jgi:glutamine amidotransferase
MSRTVTIVDYGIGNIHSVAKAMVHEGANVELTSDPEEVRRADLLVLPGVGAFGDGMANLHERGLVAPLLEFAAAGRPFLGICLGMQLFLSESDEFGNRLGLGIIPGRVVEIPVAPGRKVPHIGWNRIAPAPGASWTDSPLADVPAGSSVYFVHSFTAMPDSEDHRLADADYSGFRVSAAIRRDNVTGCQFHPEKSGEVGLSIVRRFLSSH